jgi:hypothetical protein
MPEISAEINSAIRSAGYGRGNDAGCAPLGASPAPPADHLPCVICGGPIVKRRDERKKHFSQRRTCGRECNGKLSAKIQYGKERGSYKETRTHQPCIVLGCNNPVIRRNGEAFARWQRRKCCSAECAKALLLAGSKKENRRRRTIKEAESLLVDSSFSDLCFAEHNIIPKDGGFIRLSRPATYVETRSSIGNL